MLSFVIGVSQIKTAQSSQDMAQSDALMDLLPRLNTDCDQYSPRSSAGDCPSLTDSFLSGRTSAIDTDGNRRSSFTSSPSDSPQWYASKSARSTNPPTPMATLPLFGIESQRLKMEQTLRGNHMYEPAETGLPELDFWMGTSEVDDLTFGNMPAMPLIDVLASLDPSSFPSNYSQYPQTVGMSNPALSRSIFDFRDAVDTGGSGSLEDHGLSWPPLTSSPPQTIAPSAAFQPMLMSSPIVKHEPSTPIRMCSSSSVVFSSSPMGLMSPPVVPSQHEVEDLKYDIIDDDILDSAMKRHRSGVDRLHRRGYERRRHLGPSSRPKPLSGRSGMQCDVVIAQNEFACTYPGCIDKTTGKQKRFKRQEHKKRHEKTVHEKNNNPVHRCWVPGCKTAPFSRTDNLKSHLKNTHGKKSPNQRNLYVATQDKHSEYYDLDYIGELTKEGYPVLS